jgi:metal-responsive CopG/Arc/MetJ family transcriptional regulator
VYMIKATKIAISLPTEDLKRIEKIRKESGIQRSVLIDEAIRFWLNNRDKEKMIEQYEQGYRNHPESLEEIKAMEGLSADAFAEEGLK